jgi:hypothetical protein
VEDTLRTTISKLLQGTLLLSAIVLSAQACGSSADEGTPCEQLTKQLCTLAAACGQAATTKKCSFIDGTHTQGRDCGAGCELGLPRDVCGDTTKPESLFTACLAAVDNAICSDGGSGDSLMLPHACAGLLDCKAGPCLN